MLTPKVIKYEEPNKWEDFRDRFLYPVYSYWRKITKILKFLPVLWKGEDYDFGYTLNVLEKRLENLRDRIKEDNIISDEEQRDITIQINQAIDHIRNFQNENGDAYEKNIEKFSIPYDYSFVKNKLVMINLNTFEEFTKEEYNQFDEYLRRKDEWEQNEWFLIWDTICKYGQEWWD